MNYNIEIFKSESYQKILKAVLKFRDPHLSYGEALRLCDGKDAFYIINDFLYFGIDLEPQDYGTLPRLGRPITICELTNILSEYLSRDIYYVGETLYQEIDGGCCGLASMSSKKYYVHEQMQETIDEIAKHLD